MTITYENGANVNTSFITNMEGDAAAISDPELYKVVDEANKAANPSRNLPKYKLTDYVVTSLMLSKYSKYGEKLVIKRKDCEFIRALDSQKEQNKIIYGGGLLLSEKAAAEKAAAEKAAAEKAVAIEFELSDREKAIIKNLG